MAITIQWGTTGAAIMIAYLTPVVGLGCRSGSYLVYGVAGTLSWICLSISADISNRVMVRLQHQQLNDVNDPACDPPGTGEKTDEKAPSSGGGFLRIKLADVILGYLRKTITRFQSEQPGKEAKENVNGSISDETPDESAPPSGWGFWWLQGAAVMLRYVGKTIAILNASWLISTSVFELIGMYENCWCNSNYFALHERGWVLLFKSAPDMKELAEWPWGAGLGTSFLICAFAAFTFRMFL
jgi:hypothetical protein